MRFIYRITFLLFLFSHLGFYSQDKETLSLWNIDRLIITNNTKEAERRLNLLNLNSDFKNDIRLYVAYVDFYTLIGEYSLALDYANRCQYIADHTKDPIDKAYAFYVMAKLNYTSEVFKNTVQFSNEALLILKNYPNEDMLYIKLYRLLALVHKRSNSFSEDYEKSAFESLRHAENTKQPWLILNCTKDIAYMYMVANNANPDIKYRRKMLVYFKKSLDYLNKHRNEISDIKTEIILYNNFASMINDEPYQNYTKEERVNLAEQYIKKAIDLAIKTKTEKENPIIYTTYAEILLNKNDKIKAEEYLLKTYSLTKEISDLDDYQFLIFMTNHLGDMYKEKGDKDKAIFFYKESIRFHEEYTKYRLDEKNKFIEAYYSTNEKIQKRTEAEKESILMSRKLNISIGIVLALGLLIWFLVYKNKSKNLISKQKTELLLSEKNEAELQLKLESKEKQRLKAEQELMILQQEHLSKQALVASLQLEQKKTFINELKEKVSGNEEILWDNILRSDKINDEGFIEAQNMLQEIHPNFFKSLINVSVSKLTSLDLKYAAYISLNLSNQQIANALNVELASVRTTKYRLKQKLGLGKDDDLATFINNIKT